MCSAPRPRPCGRLCLKSSMLAADAESLRLPARLGPPKPYLESFDSRFGLGPRPPAHNDAWRE